MISNLLERLQETIQIDYAFTGQKALVNAGKITEASAAVQAIKDEGRRSEALGSISAALAKQGKIDEGLQLARSIKEGRSRDDALALIAGLEAKAGNIEEAFGVVASIKGVTLPFEIIAESVDVQVPRHGRAFEISDYKRISDSNRRGGAACRSCFINPPAIKPNELACSL